MAWGTGIAAALMEATLTALTGGTARGVHLWTWEDAGRARRFYERSGFRLTGRTKTEGPAGGPPTTEVEYDRFLAMPAPVPAPAPDA